MYLLSTLKFDQGIIMGLHCIAPVATHAFELMTDMSFEEHQIVKQNQVGLKPELSLYVKHWGIFIFPEELLLQTLSVHSSMYCIWREVYLLRICWIIA